jgi:hypothetical protein
LVPPQLFPPTISKCPSYLPLCPYTFKYLSEIGSKGKQPPPDVGGWSPTRLGSAGFSAVGRAPRAPIQMALMALGMQKLPQHPSDQRTTQTITTTNHHHTTTSVPQTEPAAVPDLLVGEQLVAPNSKHAKLKFIRPISGTLQAYSMNHIHSTQVQGLWFDSGAHPARLTTAMFLRRSTRTWELVPNLHTTPPILLYPK